jgi:transposase
VATDVMGVSARAMIRALIAGQSDPATLAELARAGLRKKLPELRLALDGRVTEHHRFQLRLLMEQIDSLEKWTAELGARIEEMMLPLAEEASRLAGIPGVGRQAAEVIMAEIGADMEKFPTAGHLAAWAGMCPGNNETAGKRKSGKTTKGSQWLRTTLVQAAWAASHTKETVFAAAYRRWAKRLGKKKALIALGHKILVVAYTLLKCGTEYRELWAPPKAA